MLIHIRIRIQFVSRCRTVSVFLPHTLTAQTRDPGLCHEQSLNPDQYQSRLYYFPTLLFFHSTTLPLYNSPTLLLSNSTTLPLYNSPTLLLSHSTTFPLYYSPTLLLSHSTTFPLYYSPSLLLSHSTSTLRIISFWLNLSLTSVSHLSYNKKIRII